MIPAVIADRINSSVEQTGMVVIRGAVDKPIARSHVSFTLKGGEVAGEQTLIRPTKENI